MFLMIGPVEILKLSWTCGIHAFCFRVNVLCVPLSVLALAIKVAWVPIVVFNEPIDLGILRCCSRESSIHCLFLYHTRVYNPERCHATLRSTAATQKRHYQMPQTTIEFTLEQVRVR